MIKALYFSKIKAFRPFLKVHQKFRPYSIICAMHIRASEDALSFYEQMLRDFHEQNIENACSRKTDYYRE